MTTFTIDRRDVMLNIIKKFDLSLLSINCSLRWNDQNQNPIRTKGHISRAITEEI